MLDVEDELVQDLTWNPCTRWRPRTNSRWERKQEIKGSTSSATTADTVGTTYVRREGYHFAWSKSYIKERAKQPGKGSPSRYSSHTALESGEWRVFKVSIQKSSRLQCNAVIMTRGRNGDRYGWLWGGRQRTNESIYAALSQIMKPMLIRSSYTK